jgi:hypothetical protein
MDISELPENGTTVVQQLMSFSCCQTRGNAEIRGKASETRTGSCFFHQQDTEAAVRGSGLSLRYSDVKVDSSHESIFLNIGRKIAARLREDGLNVDWDENPKKMIRLGRF